MQNRAPFLIRFCRYVSNKWKWINGFAYKIVAPSEWQIYDGCLCVCVWWAYCTHTLVKSFRKENDCAKLRDLFTLVQTIYLNVCICIFALIFSSQPAHQIRGCFFYIHSLFFLRPRNFISAIFLAHTHR